MKIFQTKRLYLREYEENDIQRLAEIYSDEEVMKYIGIGGIINREQVQKSIKAWKNKLYLHWGFGIWALIENVSENLIGHCGFNILKENSEVEIAYLLAKDYWGKGYATEISSATLDYGFNNLNMKRIVALAYPENTASINVITKIGMKSEGVKELFGIKFLYFSIEQNGR
ncbi:MAG: GNAT family N-acetyltransferase [Bacteroidota bacterium]|nr:GNAT family N-acetyltransferase [Bacteroidota bacterium]